MENVKTLIRLGLEQSPQFFKRSIWLKVERVMEFLVNKDEIMKVKGSVKYAAKTEASDENITRWAKMYLTSPLMEHIEGMKKLSRETRIPLNSGKLLSLYMDLNTK